MKYLIINLPMTRQKQELIFWGTRTLLDTPNYSQGTLVDEEYVNLNPERYDNGVTTTAVLHDVVKTQPEKVLESLGITPTSKKGVAA